MKSLVDYFCSNRDVQRTMTENIIIYISSSSQMMCLFIRAFVVLATVADTPFAVIYDALLNGDDKRRVPNDGRTSSDSKLSRKIVGVSSCISIYPILQLHKLTARTSRLWLFLC